MRLRASAPSDILVVCTGNVCRSPYVAARLKVELPQVNVRSAGTRALVGQRPTSETLALLGDLGVTYETTAVNLTRRMVRTSPLILTATRAHRVEVTRLARGAADRIFTVLEMARLLRDAGSPSGLGLDRTLTLMQEAVAHVDDRDYDDDLADPFGRPADDYAVMAERAEAALRVVVPALRLDP